MTPQDLAAKIRAKYPGVYDHLDDNTLVQKVTEKYPQYNLQLTAEPSGQVATELQDNPAPGAEDPVEQRLVENANQVAGGYGVGMLGVGLAKGTASLASKGAGAVGKALGNAWDTVVNSPRSFGFSQGLAATPEAREAAQAGIEYANAAQPEIGHLVARAGQEPGLVSAAEALPATEAPEAFQAPIRSGLIKDPEVMLSNAQAQQQAVGKAIEQTLAKYDATGTSYDPSRFNNQIKSLMERNMNGEVMTTGWQGEVNEAIKNAASSINDYSQGGKIPWSSAARIKTGLQAGSTYGKTGSDAAAEAYKQVASILKDDIDAQATEMMAKYGGNTADYLKLKQVYGTLSNLTDALNTAAKRSFSNSAIPWWVKMAAGGYLGGKALSVTKGLMGGH